jgi:hypothetical protein
MTYRTGMLVALLFLVAPWHPASLVRAEAPEISDPDGKWPEGTTPGQYPTSVTGANIEIIPLPDGEFNGAGSDTLRVTFPSSGPIAWTESRHNEGDVAMLIGPADPADDSYYPPEDFIDNYKPFEDGLESNTTLAWRVSRNTGALLASVRHNGVDQQINLGGSPLGITHGIAYFNSGFGQGWGYRMDDGVFANGGGASADLQMGIAGYDEGAGEATFSVAAAYLPYEQGWLGAWVAAPQSELAVFSSGTPGLDSSVASWIPLGNDVLDGALGRVELPGVNSATDGMLFVAASNSDNPSNIAAGAPREGGWDIAVREDDDDDLSGETLADAGQLDYQFVYVPYDADNLVGGQVDGTDGSVVNAGGSSRFSIARRAAGEYALTILDGAGNKLTEDDGMIMLSVAGFVDAQQTLPDRAFMSYEFDPVSGDFIVQSRKLTANGDFQNSQNLFGSVLSLSDTDFYFAFLDFDNPLSPPGTVGVPGDFNDDSLLDASDIDDLTAQSSGGAHPADYDLNGDSLVNDGDITVWVKDLFNSWIGDANLDGEFNSSDLVTVLATGTYEADVNAVWTSGDFNGDGRTNSTDLVAALADGGYEAGPRAAVAAVPEPSAVTIALVALLIVGRRRCF